MDPSLLKTPFGLCPDSLCKKRDTTLCPHYLKHPCFPPSYTICAAFGDIKYSWLPVVWLLKGSQPLKKKKKRKLMLPLCLNKSDLQSAASSSCMSWQHQMHGVSTAYHVHVNFYWKSSRQNYSHHTSTFSKDFSHFGNFSVERIPFNARSFYIYKSHTPLARRQAIHRETET